MAAEEIDFLGFPYDPAHPAFVVMPHPPHPLAEDGDEKLVYHRSTRRLLDAMALREQAAAAGYTFPAEEMARDDDWLRVNTEFKVPYEFTLSLRTTATIYNDTYISYNVTGGPATRRQKVSLDPLLVDGRSLIYPRAASNVSEFWIEVGDTAAQVATKLATLDSASWPATTQAIPLVPGEASSNISTLTNPTGLSLQVNAASIPADLRTTVPVGPARMEKNPHFRGVNMTTEAGVPNYPRSAGVRSEWVDDTHTAVRMIPYGFPVGGPRNMVLRSTNYSYADKIGIFGSLTVNPDTTNDAILQGMTASFPYSTGGYTAEFPVTGYGAVLRVKNDASGEYVPQNFLPQWYLH